MTAIALANSAIAGSSVSQLRNPGTQTYTDIFPGGPSISGIRIATDGDVDQRGSSGYTDRGDWLNSGSTSNYEVRFTQNSGDALDGDTLNTYHALSSNREVRLDTPGGTEAANITVDIRHATNTSDAISFVCTLSTDATPI